MEKLYSYDRREGDVVVLVDEAGRSMTLSLSALPEGAQEGDLLRHTADGFRIDRGATQSRRQRVLALQQRLRQT